MKSIFWIFVLLILFISGIFIWKSDDLLETEPVYVAVSGPMTAANGKAMVQGIQLYLDQINQQGGIHGRPVELLAFDDKNQPAIAEKIALKIATQSEALAVIGHYTSSASLAAAPIYQKYGIPAISGSATADQLTKGNDWYFRTIFNNSDQATLLAHYVRKVLNYNEVDILFDEDVYGSTLAAAFVQTAELIGLRVKHRWHFDNEAGFQKSLEEMIATQQASPTKQGIVFLATHSTEAVEAIVSSRRQGVDQRIQFIGADALSSSNFVQKLKLSPQERTQPGYYSDGTYMTSAFLFDIANERAQYFRRAFLEKYQEEPATTSALYYDAAMLALDAIKRLPPRLKNQRQQVKNNLWQLSRLEDAVEGVTGSFYFDENGDAIKSIPIGVYKNGRAIVALHQFQALNNLQNIENLLQKVLDNQIIEVNGKFMSLARVVYAGIDFNEISEIDLIKSVYTADFFIWFRFKGDFDDDNIEFVNMAQSIPLGKPIIEQHLPDEDLTVRAYRIKTQFKAEFDFHDYPRDKQILPIYFRHQVLTREKLIYVVDVQGMNLDSFKPETNKFFSVGGWDINQVLFFQNAHQNDSTLGLPNLFNQQQRIEFSQFNTLISIERHVVAFILKTLLPVLFLIMLGYSSFFMKAFPQKLALGVNMILAASLFHLKLSSELPNINYIILIEYFFYLIYLLAVFIIVVAIAYHLKEEQEESEENQLGLKHINQFGRIFYPLILFIGIGAIIHG